MGVLFAFLVGWIVGAQGGREGYDEVLKAAKEVLASDEFTTFKAAVRTHGTYAIRQLADWLESMPERGSNVDDLLERVRRLVQPESAESES